MPGPSPDTIEEAYRTPTPPVSNFIGPQNVETQIAQQAQQDLNANAVEAGDISQYANDLWQMQVTGRHDLTGSIEVTDPTAFHNLLSSIDTFASSVGFRYYPTRSQINQMIDQGLGYGSAADVGKWLAKAEGVANVAPWAAAGLTKTDYTDRKNNLQAQMAEYTGDPAMYGELIQQALAQGSSGSSWLTTQLTTNTKYTKNSKTPWLQYGMTYQSFKQQSAQQAGKIRSIYGANATLAQQAETIGSPKQYSSSASGGAITASAASSGPLVTPSGQSSVR